LIFSTAHLGLMTGFQKSNHSIAGDENTLAVKEAGKHQRCLPALMTAEQDRAGRSMAAHEVRRSS